MTGGSGSGTGTGYGGGDGGSSNTSGGGNGAGQNAIGGYCGGGGGNGIVSVLGGGGGNGGADGTLFTGQSSAGGGGGGGIGSGGAGGVPVNSSDGDFGGGGGGFGGGGGSKAIGTATSGLSGCGGGGGFGAGGGGSAAGILISSQLGYGGKGGSFGGDGGDGQINSTPSTGGGGGGGAGIGGGIFVGDGATLTIQKDVTMSGNTVTKGNGATGEDFTSGLDGEAYAEDLFLFRKAQLIFDGTADLTASFAIQSDQDAPQAHLDGGIIQQGSNTLTLSGSNNYRGGTQINSGTLAVSDDGNLGSSDSAVNLNGGTLEATATFSSSRTFSLAGTGTIDVDDSFALTLTGPISGSGSLVKVDEGTLILRGNNTYNGGTTVSAGTLQGDTASLQGDITNNASVVFDQSSNGTYSGIMSGTGSLIKQGLRNVNFSNDSSGFTGTTTIHSGAIVVSGKLGGTCTVSVAGMLKGNGEIMGDVMNHGRIAPGTSIGTLAVNGNYTQTPSGTLVIEIDDSGSGSLLQVTGTASVSGIFELIADPGFYHPGTVYTFLTASTVTGNFNQQFSNSSLRYDINYFPNQIQLVTLLSAPVVPSDPATNNGNAIANYLFCPSFDFSNTDLISVLGPLIKLSANEYDNGLNALTHSSIGAFPLVELENNFNLINAFFISGIGQRSYCYIDSNEPTSVWINPLGSVYSQDARQEAMGFTTHTYGIAAGVDHLFTDHWSMGVGVGYSYAKTHWENQVGRAKTESGYLGPYIKFDSENFYLDFLLLGAGNFYEVHRNIVFPGISRTATSDPTSWNLSEVLLAGVRLNLFGVDNFFLQPEVLLDHVNSFQRGFKEKGANSINLSVENKYSSFLRSLINAKFVKEWVISNICLVPSINVGWLRTNPLTGGHYTAKFKTGTFCKSDFSVTSFHEIINQLLIGADFLVSCQGDFLFSIGYEGKFGKGTRTNEMNLAMRWKF